MLAPCNECQGVKLDGRRTENPRPFVQFRRILAPVVAALATFGTLVFLLAGCGGGGSSHLAVQDSATVAGFRLDVARTVVDGSGYGDLLESTDAVIALARDDPQAVYQPESTDPALTMRQVLSDAAADLGPYQPDLAAKLDRAVQTLD